MDRRLSGIVLSFVVALAATACGSAAPSPSAPAEPSPSIPGAASFDEYAAAVCAAWGTLFRVVGNPDTAGWTDDVHRLQAAATARDNDTAARLQGQINTELEAARVQIGIAAAWPPAAKPMAQMDRFFVAMERWITAYVDVAKGLQPAPDPQAVFEAAGGVEAWRGMFEAYAGMTSFRPASVAQCPGAPISP